MSPEQLLRSVDKKSGFAVDALESGSDSFEIIRMLKDTNTEE